MTKSLLSQFDEPGWMPSCRAVVILSIVQAKRGLDIVTLLDECRLHVYGYRPGQCSAAIRSLLDDGSIYMRNGLYYVTSDPLDA